MYYEKVRCEYCGRVNLTSDLDCRGCGTGIMSDPIKHEPEMYGGRPVFHGFSTSTDALISLMSSDGGGYTFGSTEPFPHDWGYGGESSSEDDSDDIDNIIEDEEEVPAFSASKMGLWHRIFG